MKESNYLQHLLPELHLAFTDGYTEDFIVTVSGLLICLANLEKSYELGEVDIGPPILLSIPGTLFRISTKDGLWKGTFIDWEY